MSQRVCYFRGSLGELFLSPNFRVMTLSTKYLVFSFDYLGRQWPRGTGGLRSNKFFGFRARIHVGFV